jgi:LacI family transcriptional regulator
LGQQFKELSCQLAHAKVFYFVEAYFFHGCQSMQERKRLTLKDLALQLGVHSSTVSRVMNPDTRHLISEDVAQRVLKAAEGHDFQPNRIASSLRTRRSHTIGVVLPDITNPLFPPILLGIEKVLSENGYVALVANAGSDRTHQRFVVDQMLARQIDGLILATVTWRDPLLAHCIEDGIAVVAVNRSEAQGKVPDVICDDLLGMRLTVDHLVGLGHRQIAHIAGPQTLSTGRLRRQGFVAAMKAHGLKACMMQADGYTREGGRIACEAILQEMPNVTAIAAGNDMIALGCYDTLRAAKRRCPEDISLVGYNDMPLADMLAPPLTTIRTPHHEMGAQAAQLLLDHIHGRRNGAIHIVLSPELVVRRSTAPPRKDAGGPFKRINRRS